MNKKAVLSLIILLFILFAFLACREDSAVKIGYVGTLSGINSDLGVSGRNGAEMAVKRINDAGGIQGKPLELIIKDDKNSKEVALQADQELYDEGVLAVVGHMTSGMADLTVPFVNENKLLMISPTIAADTLSGKDDYFFRVIPSNVEQAIEIAYSMRLKKINKIAIVYDQSNLSFTESLKNKFKEVYNPLGGEVVFEEAFSPNTVNYGKLAGAIMDSSAEGVFIIGASDNVAVLSQHLFKQGASIDIFLPSWAMTEDLLSHGGKTVEGAQLVNFYNKEYYSKEYKAFYEEYQAIYGTEPGFSAQFSYEAVMILIEALEAQKSLKNITSESIKNKILSIEKFQGLQGSIIFNQYGDIDRKNYIYEIRNGQYEVVRSGGLDE